MISETPLKPNQICEKCHHALVYHPNPDWEQVKNLFKTEALRQSVYWIATEHPDCLAEARKNEANDRDAKRRKEEREVVKRNLRELGFAQFTQEYPVAPFQVHPGVETAYHAMKDWNFQRKGILLIGPPGRGKSHLTGALGSKFSTNTEMSAAFTTMSGLLALLRRGYDEDIFDERLRMVSSQVHILILDDLGAEKVTEWGEEKLYMILDTRLNYSAEPRPLFVTTNLTAKELSERYHPRIVSRLHEMCKWIEVSGQDFRKISPDLISKPDLISQTQEPTPSIRVTETPPVVTQTLVTSTLVTPSIDPTPVGPPLQKSTPKKERSSGLKSELQAELELDYRPQLFKDPHF